MKTLFRLLFILPTLSFGQINWDNFEKITWQEICQEHKKQFINPIDSNIDTYPGQIKNDFDVVCGNIEFVSKDLLPNLIDIQNNDLPTYYQQIRDTFEIRIQRIDNEIIAIKSSLNTLEEEKKKIKPYYNAYQKLKKSINLDFSSSLKFTQEFEFAENPKIWSQIKKSLIIHPENSAILISNSDEMKKIIKLDKTKADYKLI